MFHGTHCRNVVPIFTENFNLDAQPASRRKRSIHGKGIYFSKTFSYAEGDTTFLQPSKVQRVKSATVKSTKRQKCNAMKVERIESAMRH